jgi:hypothetical protein|tara:strand:- start:369 stop:629 length:261 start_codon:yes stop_codon:yes gene_type:complete
MQKVINAIAISSGVVSLTVVIGGVSLYANRGKIIDNVKSQVMEQVSGALGSSLGGLVPDATGPAIPTPPSNPQAQAPGAVGLPPLN